MELRHLRYFIAVAQEQHMTRAAHRLGIQQPPLSQQIQDLERELSVQLFERSPRRIRLNTAGQVFLEDARKLLEQVETAVERVRQTARGELGSIRLGYTSSAAIHDRVPQVIRVFRERYPLIDLHVQENTTRDLLDALQARQLDAAFVRSTTERYPDLQAIDLGGEPMVAALPQGHRLALGTAPLALSELAHEPFVAYRRADGPGIQDVLMAACRRAGFVPRAVETVPRMLSALTMVAAGRGVSLVPASLRVVLSDSVHYRTLEAADSFSVPLTLAHGPVQPGSPLSRLVGILQAPEG
ncbi:LysR substrate-binding domain-containing protein [Pseudomonas sp. K1(2024)]|uniref:LysR substrate-binding domain-containing protein n=1 Tax=Pseudomonas boreofloridensis TaxID=3064348 RepID=A0ABV4ZE44_9PSED|nr:LysR substrate-binding domain-containing protein [Pseudomonas sp. K13]MDO7903240.1 LysR substrate-binding domain-containing protein [Pseudomonas sp. K13]